MKHRGLTFRVETREELEMLLVELRKAYVQDLVEASSRLDALDPASVTDPEQRLVLGLTAIASGGQAGLSPEKLRLACGLEGTKSIPGMIRGWRSLLAARGFRLADVAKVKKLRADHRIWLPGPRIQEAIACLERNTTCSPKAKDPSR